ncbi:MAG TPA: hypothetical protein VG204_16935 [Terriglobia bacterium]|nr:hypothetical protein [Terriglobia bacterium]
MTRQENLKQMIRAATAISKELGKQVEGLARSGQASPEELERLKKELQQHLETDTAELVYASLLYALGLSKEKQ